MARLRRVFGPTLGIWLFYQIAPLVLASAAPSGAPAAVAAHACTCPHDVDGECPMHKKAAGSTPCLVRGLDGSGAAVFGSLFGPVGLVPAPTSSMRPAAAGTCSIVELSSVSHRALPPDPPPPRV